MSAKKVKVKFLNMPQNIDGSAKTVQGVPQGISDDEAFFLFNLARKQGDIYLVDCEYLDSLEGSKLDDTQKASPINGPCYEDLKAIQHGLEILLGSVDEMIGDEKAFVETESPIEVTQTEPDERRETCAECVHCGNRGATTAVCMVLDDTYDHTGVALSDPACASFSRIKELTNEL